MRHSSYVDNLDFMLNMRVPLFFTLFLLFDENRYVNAKKEAIISDCLLVTPTGFKPITPTSVVWYSIQLSYGAIAELRVQR